MTRDHTGRRFTVERRGLPYTIAALILFLWLCTRKTERRTGFCRRGRVAPPHGMIGEHDGR